LTLTVLHHHVLFTLAELVLEILLPEVLDLVQSLTQASGNATK
jgi:hypothetical protein